MKKKLYKIIFIQACVATIGSLYYGWFGDPILNIQSGEIFIRSNGLTPCEMCWFARILMYPIVVISLVGMIKKSLDYTSVLILSGLGILLEGYQYRYQMTHSDSDIKSFICGVGDQASCAATDVIYGGFITIPFLCLIAFCIIFIATTLLQNKNSKE